MIQNKRKKETLSLGPLDGADRDEVLKKGSFIGGILRLIFEGIVMANLLITTASFFGQVRMVGSGSMTPTLYEGDIMVVNLLSVGRKSPKTLFSLANLFPFLKVPNKIFGVPTFWGGFTLPRLKIKGYGTIKNGDIMVFQDPAPQDGDLKKFNEIPLDLRQPVVKRGYGPGTNIKVKKSLLYVNNMLDPKNAKRQYTFVVTMSAKRFNRVLGPMLSPEHQKEQPSSDDGIPRYEIILRPTQIQELLKRGEDIYHSPSWKIGSFREQTPEHRKALKDGTAIDRNNVESFQVPKAGMTCALNKETHPLILKSIERENTNFRVDKGLGKRPDRFFLGQKEINAYTFKKNHWLPVGDNFHNSFDGLAYGTIPEEYIIGGCSLVLVGMKDNRFVSNFFTGNYRKGRVFKSVD